MDAYPQYDVTDRAVDEWLAEEDYPGAADDIESYRRHNLFKILFIIVCIIVAVVVSGLAMTIGEYSIDFFETYVVLWDHITGDISDTVADYVVWELRFPRILGGILAGAALAVGGVIMQGVLKNPLADTYTTGISSGASLGATLSICAGITLVGGDYATITNAFVFSLIPMFVILSVSRMKNSSVTTIIMAGIAVMYMFNAITQLLQIWSDARSLSEVYSWSVGDLTELTWSQITVMASVVIPGLIILQMLSIKLNSMMLGDDSAKTLGLNVETFRILCLLVTSLVTASVVCFTGLIGFIGLVCPHIVRMFIGSDNRFLMPASAAFGAAFLLICDTLGRVIIAPSVLQVGIITSFIGGPMFLYLIIRQKRTGW